MKDEKKAEEKYCKGCKLRIEQCLWAWRNTNGLNEPNEKNCSCKEVPAFLAGLKAGRPQWHKVTDGDLPKGNGLFVIYWKLGTIDNYMVFRGTIDNLHKDAIAWCEIPTFDKE